MRRLTPLVAIIMILAMVLPVFAAESSKCAI